MQRKKQNVSSLFFRDDRGRFERGFKGSFQSFQGSIKNPDKQVAFSQISFYEAETWYYDWFNVNKEVTWKSKSMSMVWTELSSITFEHPVFRVPWRTLPRTHMKKFGEVNFFTFVSVLIFCLKSLFVRRGVLLFWNTQNS